jgi:hypothetical protein
MCEGGCSITISEEAKELRRKLRMAKEQMTIEQAQALVLEKMRQRRAREEARKAWWKNYHEQLAKGNSNIGSGARHSKNRRVQAQKIC